MENASDAVRCIVYGITVYGNGEILTPPPTKSIPLNRSTRHLAQLITSAMGPPIPNLVEIHPQGASGKMGEI